jgi:hypothetical protein
MFNVKTCTGCGESKPLDQFWRDASRNDGLDNRCRDCKGESNRRRRQDAPERTSEILSQHRERLRTAVFDHYGRVCMCPGCSATTGLTIDHVNGDGGEHREELFGNRRSGNSRQMYRWLVNNGFPDGFQTLCLPCNSSKGKTGTCRLDHTANGQRARRKPLRMGVPITEQTLENMRRAQQERRRREREAGEAQEGAA